MTELQQAIASGQVSAAQIEAHRAAGELPIVIYEPRFQHTYCSQCGRDCGPGMDGVSGCADHIAVSKMVANPQTLRAMIETALGHYWDFAFSEGVTKISRGSEANAVLHNVRTALDKNDAALRAALDDAERLQYLVAENAMVKEHNGLFWLAYQDGEEYISLQPSARQAIDVAIDAAIKATS